MFELYLPTFLRFPPASPLKRSTCYIGLIRENRFSSLRHLLCGFFRLTFASSNASRPNRTVQTPSDPTRTRNKLILYIQLLGQLCSSLIERRSLDVNTVIHISCSTDRPDESTAIPIAMGKSKLRIYQKDIIVSGRTLYFWFQAS